VGINILRRSITLFLDGQRIEVPDRDLGTVVRWDTASKSGDPPPSITRAEGIALGLIEETEEDRLVAAGASEQPDWLETDAGFDPGPGRGRLPGGGPRRNLPARPPREERQQQQQQERPQGRRPEQRGPQRGGDRLQQQSRPEQPPRERDQRGRPDRRPPASGPGSAPPNVGEGRVFRRGGEPPPRPAGQPEEQAPGGAPGEARPEGQRSGRRRNRRRGGGGRGNAPGAQEG
jgi:hypothetical protein